jgi:hypothetical protein
VLARKAPASGWIQPGLISCKHLRHITYEVLGEGRAVPTAYSPFAQARRPSPNLRSLRKSILRRYLLDVIYLFLCALSFAPGNISLGLADDDGGEAEQGDQVGDCHQAVENIREGPGGLEFHDTSEVDKEDKDAAV